MVDVIKRFIAYRGCFVAVEFMDDCGRRVYMSSVLDESGYEICSFPARSSDWRDAVKEATQFIDFYSMPKTRSDAKEDAHGTPYRV